MLEHQFLPTPEVIAIKVRWKVRPKKYDRILDPSAGAGALLEQFDKASTAWERYNLYAIELDPDLRYTLQGKNFNVIGSDFLEYSEPCKFDCIVMNPPFAQGAKHVLRAWDFLADGGELAALLNKETIENLCDSDRKRLKELIDQQDGSVDDLGQCFKYAERPTDVEVVLIHIKKPEKKSGIGFEHIEFDLDETQAAEFAADPLAHTNILKNLVAKYKAAEIALVQRHELQSKLDFYLEGISDPVYQSAGYESKDALKQEPSLEEQVSALKSRFWNTVFVTTQMGRKTTSSFRDKFDDFSKSQSYMAFTEANIMEVLNMFFLNREQIMQDCLVEVFDKATAYHEKNKIWREGWKTNKSYRVNKRIIVPWGVTFEYGWFRINYHKQSFFTDLDKVLCWLSGTDADADSFGGTYEAINRFCDICRQPGRSYQDWFESSFFDIRMYKKGTVWLDFKDMYLLDDFNQCAAIGKKWIGGGY